MKARTAAAKRKGKRGRPKVEPIGPVALPEDRGYITNRSRLRSPPRSRSQPVARTETSYAPMYAIEARLLTAMKTIRALPDKEKRFHVVKSASLPYLQEYMDAYASSDARAPVFVPTPQDVSDCLTALSWVRHVDRKLWKIMWLRSFGFSFGLIARYIGRSDETARRWYREGITDAWTAANGVRSNCAG